MFFVLIFTLCFFFSMSGIFSAVSKYIWYMFWIRWAIYQLLFGQRNHYGCFSVSQINFAGLIYALQGSMFWKFPSLVKVRFTHTHTHTRIKQNHTVPLWLEACKYYNGIWSNHVECSHFVAYVERMGKKRRQEVLVTDSTIIMNAVLPPNSFVNLS